MKYYYIIHGFMGSNIENWFPWFKEQVDSDRCLCIIPQFPISLDLHNYDEWKKLMNLYNYEYRMINNETVIIGHSTGSIFALKYILENEVKIDKLILVSGFNNYFSNDKDDIHNKINLSYYINDSEFGKVNEFVNEVLCIYGDDDPYISQEMLHSFSSKLKAKEVIIKNGGHLNKNSGFSIFEEIMEYI